jgi:hypothetical protein
MKGLLSPGDVVADRFVIEDEIGRGGFSIVYAARDRTNDHPVAVKVLVPPPASAVLALERLKREVKALQKLDHPGIVHVIALAEHGPWMTVVLERMVRDLAQRVAHDGPLSDDACRELGIGIAEALDVAHRAGVLHRDLKPANVLLDEQDRPRLADFGSARIEGDATLTRTGAFVGTPEYTAPEVLAGDRADARADVWALGRVLAFARLGRLPETGEMVGSGLLQQVIARATDDDPALRFPTAALVADALRFGTLVVVAPAVPAFCLRCGNEEPLGHLVCASCAEVGLASDAVFLTVGDSRALVRVPRGRATAVRDRLELAGVPARIADTWWALVPRDVWFLIAVLVVFGLFEWTHAAVARGAFAMVSAAGFLLVATRIVGRPVVAGPDSGVTALSPAARIAVGKALEEIATPTARKLLGQLVQVGARAAERAPTAAELVIAATAATRELDRIDRAIAGFEQHREPSNEAWADGLARCEQARDALVQRLLEAIGALGKTVALGTTEDLDSARRELEERLRADAEIEALTP